MKKILVLLLAVVFSSVCLAAHENAGAAKGEKKEKAKKTSMKEDRWSGTIIRSSKENSTLTVGKGTVEKTVAYDTNTTWTKMNKPGADMSAFKDGSRVICVGHYDEKGRLMATRCDLRTPR